MLTFEKRGRSYMYVNRYTRHAAATKTYKNFLRCSFVLVYFFALKSIVCFTPRHLSFKTVPGLEIVAHRTSPSPLHPRATISFGIFEGFEGPWDLHAFLSRVDISRIAHCLDWRYSLRLLLHSRLAGVLQARFGAFRFLTGTSFVFHAWTSLKYESALIGDSRPYEVSLFLCCVARLAMCHSRDFSLEIFQILDR